MPSQQTLKLLRPEAAEPPDPTGSRVVKTVRPHQSGSQRWHRQFGEQLLCVRYREDPSGQQRYVTVELLVEAKPIRRTPRRDTDPMVQVYIGSTEEELRARAFAAGGQCDPYRPVWRMPLSTARTLALTKRIVST